MKQLLAISFLFLISLTGFCQFDYPAGCYMSFDEILDKSPQENHDLIVERRSNGDIKMNGGNDYKLVSEDKSIKRKTLKKEIHAFSLGDTLYLNCLPLKLQTWYTKVLSDGKYFVFIAGIPMDRTMYTSEMQAGYAFGALGGAIAGASIAMQRFLYILDKETKQLSMIDPDVLKSLLADEPDLLQEFKNEGKEPEIGTMVDYLNELNKRFTHK